MVKYYTQNYDGVTRYNFEHDIDGEHTHWFLFFGAARYYSMTNKKGFKRHPNGGYHLTKGCCCFLCKGGKDELSNAMSLESLRDRFRINNLNDTIKAFVKRNPDKPEVSKLYDTFKVVVRPVITIPYGHIVDFDLEKFELELNQVKAQLEYFRSISDDNFRIHVSPIRGIPDNHEKQICEAWVNYPKHQDDK